MEDALQDALKA